MKTLVIETSTTTGSVAVLQGGEVQIEQSFHSGRGSDALLFSTLQEILARTGEIGLIIVGVGPGGYSGLRMGVSVAFGLKMGLSIPAIGMYSVLGYAASDYQVVLDGRGSWIFAEVKAECLVVPPMLLDTPGLLQRLNAQAPIYCTKALPGGLASIPEPPQAAILGRRQARGLAGPSLPLKPLYLKPPHITPSKTPLEWVGGNLETFSGSCQSAGTGRAYSWNVSLLASNPRCKGRTL